MSSGENRNRREPDGEENGANSLTNSKQLSQRSRHLKAAGKHVQEDVNLSDDSLEDDGPEPVAASTLRDGERDNTQRHSRAADSVARNSSHSNQHVDKRTNENTPVNNGATSPVHSTTPQQHINSDNDIVSDKGRLVHGSAKSSQTSSRASSCVSKIPVLKRPKAKPSPLVEASKASLSSAAMVTTTGGYPPPSEQTEDSSDTPISIPIDEMPVSDSLDHDEQPVVSHNQEEHVAVTIQTCYRGQKSNRNPETNLEAPPQEGRAQDGQRRKLRNSNSFNSYVHEQMAITMAMMEANFEGVGLSHTQQERVEELRAGLDSFSLTNTAAAATTGEQQHEPHPQIVHNHWNDSEPSSNSWNGNRKRLHASTGIEMTHGGIRSKLLYKSQSCDTSYQEDIHHKSGNKRCGSYLQQSKVAQSIKSLKPPKLKPLPRRQSSNYLQNYIKSNKGSVRSNRQWSPAHMIPPLDESTPVNHTHWDSAMIGPRDHMTYHYPVLPNIGDSYSTISLHPAVKPYKSYHQHHWPGLPPPQPTYRTHPRGGHYYTRHYSQHRH
ncbi:uncharacterized protein [Dysidea avara]|uniref:uncharacterized protein isoform X2 n=1 Tax=Dysidea avara TaxID=196820 RepID=UPI003331D735